MDAQPTRSDIRSLLGAPGGRHRAVARLDGAEGGGRLEHGDIFCAAIPGGERGGIRAECTST